MPRCTCNNCVCCAGVPEWDARVMSNAERVTRTFAMGPPDKDPPFLSGPYLFVGFLSLWVPGLLSSKYWI